VSADYYLDVPVDRFGHLGNSQGHRVLVGHGGDTDHIWLETSHLALDLFPDEMALVPKGGLHPVLVGECIFVGSRFSDKVLVEIGIVNGNGMPIDRQHGGREPPKLSGNRAFPRPRNRA